MTEMKSTELRIGNLVNVDGKAVAVESINNTGINLFVDDGIIIEYADFNTDINYSIKPIPLTEEWLIKLGFEKQMEWTYAINLVGKLKLVYYLGEKGFSIGYKNYSDFKCKYVHQLQNLYFALTGEELTLNP